MTFVKDIFEKLDDNFLRKDLPPGSAEWSHGFDGTISGLIFVCPCGCGIVQHLPVSGNKAWKWDGDEVNPTLHPSVLNVGKCGWHGHLVKGEWRKC